MSSPKRLLLSFLIAASAFAQVPDNLTYLPDQVYSNAHENLAADFLRPKDAQQPLPLIVMVHGGGFRAGKRQSKIPQAIRLAQNGYAVATISYGLAPKYPFPAAVQDVKTAIRFFRSNASKFGIDPSRIGVTGDSAGGHLVLMLGLTANVPEFETQEYAGVSDKVQAVVNYYGPTDLTKSCGKSVDACEVLPLFLGGDVEHARARYIMASPLNWVTPVAAPVLTLHGTVDRYVNYEHAGWITDRLKSAGVETKLVTFEGADHGFKGKDAEAAEREMIAWFDHYLKGK